MPEPFFERLKLCLEPKELMPLICESFSQKELVRLLASAGVVYPGIRMETLRNEELASGWARDAWKDPEVLDGLVNALDNVHAEDIAQMRLASLDEMERLPASVARLCRQREISGLIWALLREERADVALVRRFLDAFYRYLKKGAAASEKMERFEEHLREGKLNKKETERVRGILVNLVGENNGLKQTLDKAARESARLTRQIDDLKRKASASQAEIAALNNDLAGLRKEASRKDALIHAFEHKAGDVSAGEGDLLRRRIHDLERSERKLQHEIGDFAKRIEDSVQQMAGFNEKLAAANLEVQAAQGRCREFERMLQEERLRREGLERDLERLARQGHARAHVPPSPLAEKAFSSPRERGRRLGVFVDTRYLWQASRLVQKKIDYQKLLDFIVLDRHLVKAVAYVMTAPDSDLGGFPAMLEKKGFHVRSRPLARWPDGSLYGSWGAGIAADMIFSLEKLSLDIVHLVSGSGDFADLLKWIRARGLMAEVSGFKIDADVDPDRVADGFISLGAEIFRDSV